MTNRQWLYETLLGDPALVSIVGNRVWQGEALSDSRQVKPFLIYRYGNDTDEDLAEEDAFPHRQFFQIYIHDQPTDYSLIDDICDLIKQALRTAVKPRNIISLRYLETSRDMDDPILGTIFRYMRFSMLQS